MTEATPKDRLDALVFRYLERIEGGEEPDAVLGALCAEAPDDADGLRRGVGLLRRTRLHPGASEDGLPERIGPFRLLRRLGSGGMGVVYQALQQHPERLVALKLVRPDQLWFDGARERFAREIASTARLSHTGIAPLYEAGEHDGVPWFSQEYVPGASLDRVLAAVPTRDPSQLRGKHLRDALADALADELPADDATFSVDAFEGSWSDACLRIGLQVAEALSHAHERGVLHRDVKPGNIMLTPSGRAVLVDFGLATHGGVDRLTRSGAQIGSLLYMSPEQLDGRLDEVGPVSDVYALGVTLYEMLTLRLPYASASVERLRGMILDGAVPAPHRSNTALSDDVSAICLHAMERQATQRYPGAGNFAEDMGRALRGEPVHARTPSAWQRTTRWCRRRPASAAAIVLGVLAFVVAPVVIAVDRSRAAAETELHFEAALDAIEQSLRILADRDLQDLPGLSPLRLRIIDKALQIFRGLAEARPEDARVASELALLQASRSEILQLIGRHDEALAASLAAERAFAAAGEPPVADGVLIQERAVATQQRAALLVEEGKHAEAEALLHEALGLFRQALALQPSHTGRRSDIVRVRTQLSAALTARGDLDGALKEALAAETEARALLALVSTGAAGPTLDEAEACERIAYALNNQHNVHVLRGEPLRAAEVATAGLLAIERVLSLKPGALGTRIDHARMLSVSGVSEAKVGRLSLGRTRLERSVELFDVLAEEEPDLPSVRDARIAALYKLAHVASMQRDMPRAVELGAEVAATRDEILATAPDDLQRIEQAARASFDLAADLYDHKALGESRYADSLARASRTLDLLPQLLASDKRDFARKLLFGVSFLQAVTRAHLHDLDGAQAALALMDQAADTGSALVTFRRAEARGVWIACAADAGRDVERSRLGEEAVSLMEQAVALGFSDVDRLEQGETWAVLGDDPRLVLMRERLAAAAPVEP